MFQAACKKQADLEWTDIKGIQNNSFNCSPSPKSRLLDFRVGLVRQLKKVLSTTRMRVTQMQFTVHYNTKAFLLWETNKNIYPDDICKHRSFHYILWTVPQEYKNSFEEKLYMQQNYILNYHF